MGGQKKRESPANPAERWDVDDVSGTVRVRTPRPSRQLPSESERARQLLEPLRESDPHDLLTGLLNWGHFAMSLHEAVEYAKREGRALSLILLDIDYLDRIRVHHGSNEVTRLLVEVAAVCLRELTDKQLVGRFAQCRLGILLSHSTPGEAAEIAERVLTSVREHVCFGAGFPVTLSAGCAALSSVVDQSTGGLIDLAEQRLEEAGDMGGNQVIAAGRFWDSEPA